MHGPVEITDGGGRGGGGEGGGGEGGGSEGGRSIAPEAVVPSVESTSNVSLAMPLALARGRGLWRRRTGALRVGGSAPLIAPPRAKARAATRSMHGQFHPGRATAAVLCGGAVAIAWKLQLWKLQCAGGEGGKRGAGAPDFAIW